MPKKNIHSMPWYSERAGFFGRQYLVEYADFISIDRTNREVDFLIKILRLKKGAKILDLACGHGRHTIELARRGFKMTGQDINSLFLKKAKQSAQRIGLKINWIKSDMRRITFENEFDVVVNLFTAFGYLESDDEDQTVISQIARALRPGGKFAIDFINRDRIMRTYREKDWTELPNHSILLSERGFNMITGRNEERRMIISKNGKRKIFNPGIRMYTLSELITMCRNAGLKFIEVYGDYDGSSINLDSKRCILIVKK